ncbi:hypothetical protein JCM3765_003562 [Sporobolomyces pararoseus]
MTQKVFSHELSDSTIALNLVIVTAAPIVRDLETYNQLTLFLERLLVSVYLIGSGSLFARKAQMDLGAQDTVDIASLPEDIRQEVLEAQRYWSNFGLEDSLEHSTV